MKTRTIKVSALKLKQFVACVQSVPDSPVGQHLTEAEFLGYRLGLLGSDEVAPIDAHLASCPDCVEEMEYLLQESKAWQSAETEEHLADIKQKLREQFVDETAPGTIPHVAPCLECATSSERRVPVLVEATEPVPEPKPPRRPLAQRLQELLEKLTAVIRPVFGAEAMAALAAASAEEEELKEVWDSKHHLDPLRCIVYRERDGDLLLHFFSTDSIHENHTFEVVVKEQTRPTVTFRRNTQGKLFGEARIPRDELAGADLSKLTFRLKKS